MANPIQRFLALVSGQPQEVVATTTSGGAASEGLIPALNASGQIDSSMLSGIANIQIALPTTAIAANSCTAPATVSMPGLLTTSAIMTAFASNPTSVTGWGINGGLVLIAWPSANTLNWSVCNQTGASITPGAMTLNVGAR